jgi:hypothetical protein
MILYKYRQVNEYTAQIFTSKKIWLSTPAQLNDPFETEFHIPEEEFRAKIISEMKQGQLVGFIQAARYGMSKGKFFGMTRADTIRLVKRFTNFKTEGEAYSAFVNFIKAKIGNPPSNPEDLFSQLQEQIASVGIFSLSEICDDLLMWSHYADSHKGLCLGFEVTDGSSLADESHFLPVNYSGAVPHLEEQFMTELSISVDKRGKFKTGNRISFSEPTLRATISTKGKEWDYEKEWRYVEESAGAFNWPGPIVEIVFGLNCPAKQREYYTELAKENISNDVRFYEIKKKPGTRELEKIRIFLPVEEIDLGAVISIEEIDDLLESRRYLKALPMLERLLEANPSAELWRKKGIALGWCEDHLAALECFNKAIILQPNHASAWYQKGVALTQIGRFYDAIDAYKESRKLGLRDPSISFNLGSLLAALGQNQVALNELNFAKKCGHPRAAEKIRLLQENS